MHNQPAEAALWTEPLRVRSYDVDFLHRAKLDALARFFFEAAWNHAEALGVGFSHLAAQKQFWVLSRLAIKIDRCPTWGQNLRLETWPRSSAGILAWRDFEIFSDSGERCAAGASGWLVLDASTRRPQRLDKLNWSIRSLPTWRALDRDPGKALPPKTRPAAASLPGSPPGPIDAPSTQPAGVTPLTLAVRFSDLDVNHHVNSATYIRWLLDAYPMEFHRAHSPVELEVSYLGETVAGDHVIVSAEPGSPGEFYHCIRKSTGEEVCRARLQWRLSP